ncbi:hypothetical protein [Mycobacterium sp.]|uniref:hypothetical protein n=1 Tax=Mycobacterium sp. TaxID=1785 RepID=UPI003F9C81DA
MALAALVCATTAAVVWLSVVLFERASTPKPGPGPSAAAPPAPAPSTSQPPSVVAAPPLDGTYRLDHDYSKETINGQLLAHPPDNTSDDWMGFRSSCTSAGCVATGTALDSKNLQAPMTPAINYVLHWINGRWQSDDRTYRSVCYIVGEDSGASYHETGIMTLSLQPQPDGTYHGTTAWTIQTNECGDQGIVHVVPIVLWRTGPVPPGVVVDPPTMSALQQPTSAQGPTPGR